MSNKQTLPQQNVKPAHSEEKPEFKTKDMAACAALSLLVLCGLFGDNISGTVEKVSDAIGNGYDQVKEWVMPAPAQSKHIPK